MLGKRGLALYRHLCNLCITICVLTQILSLKVKQEEHGEYNIETNVFANNSGIWFKTVCDKKGRKLCTTQKLHVNIFVQKQHLDLRQPLRWETSSPAFEKSLSEGSCVAEMRNKCIALSDNWDLSLCRTFCLSRSSPVPLSVLDFPSVRPVTPLTHPYRLPAIGYTITNLNNQTIVLSLADSKHHTSRSARPNRNLNSTRHLF